ncbi:EAL domain-containing protein [uncultured Ruminococcus sp.]|uniref:EAL domain-containing protein n=1 Tax=uncultured Ruminococcus sp. TaxID=165186 RepID=UPI0029304316|nr:EAL domain-containing protein [uncultured Ruminococcus sp.]
MKNYMTASGIKRRVLIVDDELINRELLSAMLSQTFEIETASNGQESMMMLTRPDANYSLILLDLMMPVMDGFEVIERCQKDEALKRIPIIVMTSEKSAEVRSIRMGAADFITKPYDMPEVILARCERIIELSEDKSIIRSTERDKVSGLYTRSYFFAYLQQMVQRLEKPMDALVLNLDRFHLINELFGRDEGDRVLAYIGELISEKLSELRGIACRSESDTFFLFCERQEEYESLMEEMQSKLAAFAKSRSLRLRAGIYSCEEHESDPEAWFSRAKSACDRIRGQYGSLATRYNNELYERTVFHERLIGDIDDAINRRDFVVYFQPKYRIQGERPVLTSAEALIRWIHPELGFISPGEFIPLFEQNGLIRRVDHYVWRSAAEQIKCWREQYGMSIPISVNVSRVDIFDPELEKKLCDILDEFSLAPDDLMLEITESAYADSADRLIEVVNSLRDKGFKIEMDDFGSGYSSLNMLTEIPIDVLKIDMQFIRRMLLDDKNLKLVRLVMDIAEFLDVPVVAEGVEEEEQLNVLRKMGCDIVQGYYFSPPLPAERFGELIRQECQRRGEASC